MNGLDLLASALEFVENTPRAAISFGGSPTVLSKDPWVARTMCSTLITALERLHGRAPVDRVELYGKSWPRAEDYHAAILANSGVAKVERIEYVRPGDLIAIRFRERQGDFSGHCALVAGIPEEQGKGRYRVAVVDSTNSPHGARDPRALGEYRGLGKAEMILLTQGDVIAGYQWSPTSEPRWIADGERMVAVGRFV